MAISKQLWIHGEGDGDDIPDDINTWKATDPDEDDDRNSRTQLTVMTNRMTRTPSSSEFSHIGLNQVFLSDTFRPEN